MSYTGRATPASPWFLLVAAMIALLALPAAASAGTPTNIRFTAPNPGALVSGMTYAAVTWTDPDQDQERFRVGASTTMLGAYGARYGFIDPTGLPDGPHLFTPLVKYDSSSTYFSGEALMLHVDNAAPTTTITAGPAADDIVGVGTQTFSVTASDGYYGAAGVSAITCTLRAGDTAAVLESRSCKEVPFTTTWLGVGRYRFTVDATDRRGHAAVSQHRDFTVVAAPRTRIMGGAAEGATVSRPVQGFTLEADDAAATLSCRMTEGDAAVGPMLPCTPGTYTTPTLADGEWLLEVVAARGAVVGQVATRRFTVLRTVTQAAPIAPQDPTPGPTLPPLPSPSVEAALDTTPGSAQAAPAPRYCVVPVLRGYSLAAARIRLKQANCSAGVITRARGKRTRIGRVCAQGMAAGTVLVAGRRIGIRIGR